MRLEPRKGEARAEEGGAAAGAAAAGGEAVGGEAVGGEAGAAAGGAAVGGAAVDGERAAAAAKRLAPAVGTAPGWLTRLGLAIVQPRWALTVAIERKAAGRSGSDLIAAIAVLLLATQLRGLASAVWLGTTVSPGLGARAAVRVLTGALTVDLGLLLLAAFAVFALAGARRNLGRAFDLACVAALPLVFVDLAATTVVRAAGLAVPPPVGWLLSGLAYGWMGALIALAIRPARVASVRTASPPLEVVARARHAGWAVAGVAALGVALQVSWVAGNLELVKPMTAGDPAPEIAARTIETHGALGPPVTLAGTRGKVVVLDFWATWCAPCLASMPKLDQLARSHPDVVVIAINLDDPAGARALFEQRHYAMTLVFDEGHTDERYGVTAIPHTVILDRRGVIREVVRGSGRDLVQAVEAIARD